MARLGDICKFQSGGTPSKGEPSYFNGNIPWITTVALNGSIIDESHAIDWITEKAIEKSAAKIVPTNSVMVGTRVGVGKVAINKVPMSTSQDIISLLDIDESKWSKEFICKFILGKGTYLNSQARGATIKGIKIETLAGLQLPDIPLEQQCKIAIVIDTVNNLIALRKEQLAKLDQLVKSRFIELFGDPVQNPMGWKIETLKKATTKIGSGATPKGGKESYQTEGITLIRSMNVHDGRFEYKDLAHITDEQAKQLDNVTVEENDVFINITGASVARSCIVPGHILPARVNQHVAIIRCIASMLHPVFANQMFLNASFKGQLLDIGESGGATRQAITKQQLETLDVILPPLELQEQFATFVEQTDKSKMAIQQSLDKLVLLKKTLMQEYFG